MSGNRKEPYDMTYNTLVNYARDSPLTVLNWVFPVDMEQFKPHLTKCEKMGMHKPEWWGKIVC